MSITVGIPVSQEVIEKTGRRAIIYPLCKECYVKIDDPEFEKKKENTVISLIESPGSTVLDF